jgi:hypothetical protein
VRVVTLIWTRFAAQTLFAWREEAAEGDLVFDEDTILSVMATEGDSGWWTGRIGGVEGIFPANYVERIEEASLNLEPAGGGTAGRAGGLKGKVGHRASWKKRWFVVRAGALIYYKSAELALQASPGRVCH